MRARCIEIARQQIAEQITTIGAHVGIRNVESIDRSIDRFSIFGRLEVSRESMSYSIYQRCSRSLFRATWLVGRSIADLARKSSKKREREEMEVIRTSALKLVCPRGGSTCPLKISKRYRDRVSRARLTKKERAKWAAHTRALYP